MAEEREQVPAPTTSASWEGAPSQILVARGMQNTVERRQERMYGFSMKFEPIGSGEHQTEVTFECVDAGWYDKYAYGKDIEQFWDDNPAPPAARVTLLLGRTVDSPDGCSAQINEKEAAQDLPAPAIEVERWYVLTLAREKPARPPVATCEPLINNGDYALGFEMSLLRFDLPTSELERDLVKRYEITGGGVAPQVMQDNQEVAFVGVLNVGQGGCNALYGADRRPFLYYDFGRSRTLDSRPDNMKPCMATAPQIVLSNWDVDHYELARSYSEGRHLPWLALAAGVGATTGAFFRSLTHKRVWPLDRHRFEEYAWGFILRAYGSGNNDGLVALVRVRDDSNAPPVGSRRALDAAGARPEIFADERYVLMTGDAMFQHIPSCEAHDLDGKIIGINAVHHGAYAGMAGHHHFIPLAAEPLDDYPATVAYSYGFNRSTGRSVLAYGHPRTEAIEAYKFRGYHLRRNTNPPPLNNPADWVLARNVVLGWRRGNVPAPAGAAAAAIAAARQNFDQVRLAARPALAESQATTILFDAAWNAARSGHATVAQVTAAVQAALPAALLVPGLAANFAGRVQPEWHAANAQANRELARDQFAQFDAAAYAAALAQVNAIAVAAELLAQAVAQNDPAYPGTQPVHCQGAPVAPMAHPMSMPVTRPGPVARGAVVAAPVPTALHQAVQISETLGPTRVQQRAHGLVNGDQVTIAGSTHAATNAQHAITRVSDDEYTIPVARAGAPVTEPAFATRQVAGTLNANVAITDDGARLALVRHPGHALQPGSQVTISQAPGFNGTGHYQLVDLDNYGIPMAGPAIAQVNTMGQANGTRGSQEYTELCSLADPGVVPTIVTHLNHRLQNGNSVDIQGSPHYSHNGPHVVTFIGAGNYSIQATCGALAGVPNLLVTGTRSNFAFPNEAVELSVGSYSSTVVLANHGMRVGGHVVLANGTHPVYAGPHRVIAVAANSFQIEVGTGDGQAYHADITTASGQFVNEPVTLIDPGRVTVVTHPNHGLATDASVRLINTGFYDGDHVILVLDGNRYAIAQVTGVARNPAGICTLSANMTAFTETVATHDDGTHTIVHHPRHGLPSGVQVTLAGGAHVGLHALVRVDEHHYTINHTTTAALMENRITANGVPVHVFAGTHGTRIRHLNHGLVNGHVVLIAGAWHPPLNANHAILVIDANHYEVAVPFSGRQEMHAVVTAHGARALSAAEAPIAGIAPASEVRKRDADRETLLHGNQVQKERMNAALAYRRQQLQQPNACTGGNCGFTDLRRI